MIKVIAFDLDGVLLDAKQMHFDTLNQALYEIDPKYVISWTEHLLKFDGLKTNTKLDILAREKGLPEDAKSIIWSRKQELTLDSLCTLERNGVLIDVLASLGQSYKIACCSNSVRKTVFTILARLGIIEYFDLIISNEDVARSKPHPDMYWKAMSSLGSTPKETLIIEDSPVGLVAAADSGAHVLRVATSKDVTYGHIENTIKQIEKVQRMKNTSPKWKDERLTVLIPMAGAGSRFEKAGYTFPKPLIDINGKPMIHLVVENLNIDAHYVYIVQKMHRVKYNLDTLLNLITPGCNIVETEGVTEGAACTALLAKKYLQDTPLLMANSDQFVEWDSNDFLYKMNETAVDGGIVTFETTHPKWSFARLGADGFVSEVAEKNPISNIGTVGIYYWQHGTDFVKYAEQMIEKNTRVNNEFYICPVFNEAIGDGKKIKVHGIDKMWGLGTPEDLDHFLKNYGNPA